MDWWGSILGAIARGIYENRRLRRLAIEAEWFDRKLDQLRERFGAWPCEVAVPGGFHEDRWRVPVFDGDCCQGARHQGGYAVRRAAVAMGRADGAGRRMGVRERMTMDDAKLDELERLGHGLLDRIGRATIAVAQASRGGVMKKLRHLYGGGTVRIAEENLMIETIGTLSGSSLPVYQLRNERDGRLIPMPHETLEWLVNVGLAEVLR